MGRDRTAVDRASCFLLFRSIRAHYDLVRDATAPFELTLLPARQPIAVVPLRRWELAFVHRLEQDHPERPIAVIIPQLMELRWYHRLLHGHAASMMKTLLLLHGGPQTVVVNTPFYLRAWRPERAKLYWRGPLRVTAR